MPPENKTFPENETRQFLGPEYSWRDATLALKDVQGLHGGVELWLPRWGDASVTRVGANGRAAKFKVPITRQERLGLIHLCIEQDFVTMPEDTRMGVPDEARPSITLTNRRREEHTVSRWANSRDERFEVIYQALLDIAARTEGRKPIPERFSSRQKRLFWLGIGALAVLPFVLGFLLARTAVALWWPDHISRLAGVLIGLAVAFPLMMAGLRLFERHKMSYDRLFTNMWLLIMLSWVYLALLLMLPGFLQRISLVVWADTTVGTVQSLNVDTITDDTGSIDVYQVRYLFQTADGREYEKEVGVNRATYAELKAGDELLVSYLPFFPRYSLLEYNLSSEMIDYALLLFTAVFALYLFVAEAALFGPFIFRVQAERL